MSRARARIRWSASVIAIVVSLTAASTASTASAARSDSSTAGGDREVAPEPLLTFVSSPDLFNADVGDLRRPGRRLVHGLNSWNRDYAVAVDKVFTRLASYDADAYLVAGDLVEGHWGVDADRTGYFGPVRTRQQRLGAIRRAGDFYYAQVHKFFTQHGIARKRVYAAVGDHEIGDNPWVKPSKLRTVSTYKAVWAEHFTTAGGRHRFPERPVGTPFADTSYATWLTPRGRDGVLLVTLDVFRHSYDGVTATVRDGHLRWLRSVLASAPASATVIVQGHTPVLTPVRSVGSSNLVLDGGQASPLWRLLESSGKVDLYLAGEVHATTARRSGDGSGRGPVQITHGGLFAFNGTSYLHGRVYPDRVELDSWDFPTRFDTTDRLWATSTKRPPAGLTYGKPALIGTLVLHADGSVDATGALELNPALS